MGRLCFWAAFSRWRFFIGMVFSTIPLLFANPLQAGNFIDDLGRSVEIPKNPARIVSLAPSITEVLFALGLDEEIAGVTRFSNYPPQASAKPKVGTYVKLNLEKIVSLNPDLVVATAGGNSRVVVERLEEIGLPVFVVYPKKINDIYSNIRSLGIVTGKEKEGVALAVRIEEKIMAITDKVENLPKPKVFFQLGANPLYTAGGGTFIDDLIRMAGGLNISGDEKISYPVYSMEEVIKRAPQVIFSVLMGSQRDESVIAFWEQWPTIPAIRDKHLYAVDPDLVNRPAPRIVEALEAIARRLHPEVFEPVSERGKEKR